MVDTNNEKNAYGSESIKVIEGLEAVRMRPGMYIGSTGKSGYHHLIWEIIDNSVDEAMNGNGDCIELCLLEDGSISIEDWGRGMPIDIHPVQKKPGVEIIFTVLHAGGKFGDSSYSYSGGLHGVGASVVNALSKWLKAEICRDGIKYGIEFHYNEAGGEKNPSGKLKTPLYIIDKKSEKKSGSYVRFLPDSKVFTSVTASFDTICRKLREIAFLNKGLKLIVKDKRVNLYEGEEKVVEYRYDGGLIDFVNYKNEGKTKLYKEPIYVYKKYNDFILELAMAHTEGYDENIYSYVNNISTIEGGMHETGFKSALTKIMNDLVSKRKSKLNKKLEGEDCREGLTAVLAIKMKDPQFEGQTKSKLGNSETRPLVERLCIEEMTDIFDKNPKVVESILDKALKALDVREKTQKQKKLERDKNAITAGTLVGKLANCSGKGSNNEIFIVEGDSAGGSAKQGRDRSFQAILPLRGKPKNSERSSMEEMMKNEELKLIIHVLGANFGNDFDVAKLRYDKVIILADADQDGGHIRAILLTFFFKYMKKLIIEGHLYIGMPPLYKVEKGDYIAYAYDKEELDKCAAIAGRGYKVQRYKGLGEMNPDQLWDTTMNPNTRKLIRVTIDDMASADDIVNILMGAEVARRKEYINENANFNKIDEFEGVSNG